MWECLEWLNNSRHGLAVMTPALHAGGPEFDPRCLYFYWELNASSDAYAYFVAYVTYYY